MVTVMLLRSQIFYLFIVIHGYLLFILLHKVLNIQMGPVLPLCCVAGRQPELVLITANTVHPHVFSDLMKGKKYLIPEMRNLSLFNSELFLFVLYSFYVGFQSVQTFFFF